LARQYGVSQGTISGIVRDEQHVVSITRSQAHRKYPVNEHVFESIEEEANAYWLGFLAADGYLIARSHAVGIGIGLGDLGHLEKFRDWIQPNRPIHTRIRHGFGQSSSMCQLEIASQPLYDSLCALGLGPRKTFTMDSRPLMSEGVVRHFYRGYIDGDGYIGLRKHKNGAPLGAFAVVGTHPFLTELQVWLSMQLGCEASKLLFSRNIWYLTKGGTPLVARICRLIYGDASIYLERKYAAALQVIETSENGHRRGWNISGAARISGG
jgi:hypothetical protein